MIDADVQKKLLEEGEKLTKNDRDLNDKALVAYIGRMLGSMHDHSSFAGNTAGMLEALLKWFGANGFRNAVRRSLLIRAGFDPSRALPAPPRPKDFFAKAAAGGRGVEEYKARETLANAMLGVFSHFMGRTLGLDDALATLIVAALRLAESGQRYDKIMLVIQAQVDEKPEKKPETACEASVREVNEMLKKRHGCRDCDPCIPDETCPEKCCPVCTPDEDCPEEKACEDCPEDSGLPCCEEPDKECPDEKHADLRCGDCYDFDGIACCASLDETEDGRNRHTARSMPCQRGVRRNGAKASDKCYCDDAGKLCKPCLEKACEDFERKRGPR